MDVEHPQIGKTLSNSTSTAFSPVPFPGNTRQQQQENLDLSECPIRLEERENFNQINEDEIRKSLLVEAKRRKCWNSKAIEKMVFEEIVHNCCYHYVLESFTETRSTADAVQPSSSTMSNSSALVRIRSFEESGSTVDISTNSLTSKINNPTVTKTLFSADFGHNPWDFDVKPDDDFVNQIKILEMPNSQRLSTCHTCKGEALIHCFHCRGLGTDKCTYCRGTGMKAGVAHPALYTHPMIGTFSGDNRKSVGGGISSSNRGFPFSGTAMIKPALLGSQRDKPYAAGTPVHFMAKAGLPPPGIGQHDLCIFCHGRGIRDCQHCKGQGKKCCLACGGNGQVRIFTKLKVAFAVECSDFYTPCEMPDHLLRQANGQLIFTETRPYVHPIRKHKIKEINEVSKHFCAAHLKRLLDSCRVLKQRHCIERIMVAKVRFKLGSKCGRFFVFGDQRLCYIPKESISSNCSLM
uniref:Protein SSUH2-like protein n=1 Tax=Meloidogyne floridensis TaxID=298350 RepID=A0A915NT75_9BILA